MPVHQTGPFVFFPVLGQGLDILVFMLPGDSDMRLMRAFSRRDLNRGKGETFWLVPQNAERGKKSPDWRGQEVRRLNGFDLAT